MSLQAIVARLGGVVAQSTRQELNVGLFVVTDLDETSTDPRRKSCVYKVGFTKVLKGTSVEGVLEVLKSESIVENGCVCDVGGIITRKRVSGDESQRDKDCKGA